jgi:hypothetical protein
MKKVYLANLTDEKWLELADLYQQADESLNIVFDFIEYLLEQDGFEVVLSPSIEEESKLFNGRLFLYFQAMLTKFGVAKPTTDEHKKYYLWNHGNALLITGEHDENADLLRDIADMQAGNANLLCNIADVQIDYEQDAVLVYFFGKKDAKNTLIIRECENMYPVEVNPTFINKYFDLDSFKAWLGNKRLFNTEYKKHGVNGVGNWIGESRLLCSYEKAQKLLDDAFSDGKSPHLYNFDTEIGYFIKFKNENRGNWYHGYHIETTNDEKLQIFDCVTQETRKKLEDRQKQASKKKK